MNYKKIIFTLSIIASLIKDVNAEGFFSPYRMFFSQSQSGFHLISELSLNERGFTDEDYNQINSGDQYKFFPDDKNKSYICFKDREYTTQHLTFLFDDFGSDSINDCNENQSIPGNSKFISNPEFSLPQLEFKPSPLFWRLYYNSSITSYSISQYIIDYPNKNEISKFTVNAYNLNLPLYIQFGDANLGSDGSFSLRIGAGPSISFIENFELKSAYYTYRPERSLKLGLAKTFELVYSYLGFKFDSTEFYVPIDSGYYKNDTIYMRVNTVLIGFFIYF
jgi:hypothetical protein